MSNYSLKKVKFFILLVLCWLFLTGPAYLADQPEVFIQQNEHIGEVLSVAFTPDWKLMLSGSKDKTLKLWDLSCGQVLRTFTGHTDTVNTVVISPDGKYALSGSEDRTLKLWDLNNGQLLRTFEGHTDAINVVVISPDGKYALSGSDDGTLKLWDLNNGKLLRTLIRHSGAVYSAAFTPDGKYALSGSTDNTLKLWDAGKWKEIRTFKGHSGSVYTVAISADSQSVLSGGFDDTIKLWNLSSGQELRTITFNESQKNNVISVAISPDGKYALSGSSCWDTNNKNFTNHSFKLWDLSTCKQLRSSYWDSLIRKVAFSPDMKFVLVAGFQTLGLFDVESGKVAQLLNLTRAARVTSVAFSPDGKSALV